MSLRHGLWGKIRRSEGIKKLYINKISKIYSDYRLTYHFPLRIFRASLSRKILTTLEYRCHGPYDMYSNTMRRFPLLNNTVRHINNPFTHIFVTNTQ